MCSPSTLSSNLQSTISKLPTFILQVLSACTFPFLASRENWLSIDEAATPAVLFSAVCFVSQGSTAPGLHVKHVASLLFIAAFRQFSNPPSCLIAAHFESLSSYYITSDSSLLLPKHQGSSSLPLPNPPTHSLPQSLP